jgi:Glycosyl hydrolase family 45
MPGVGGAAVGVGVAGNGSPTSGSATVGSGGSAPDGGGAATGGSGTSGGVQQTGGTNASGGTTDPGMVCDDLLPNNGETCVHAVEYGWCTMSWLGSSCRKTCGKCSGGSGGSNTGGASTGGTASGGSTGTGGSLTGAGGYGGGGSQPPAISGGTQGKSTRYWDCCKPAGGWSTNTGGRSPVKSCTKENGGTGADTQSACSGGGAYQCWDVGPWGVSSTLAYGYAAKNDGSAGKCYQLQFDGKNSNATPDAGSQALKDKTMIVQIINFGDIGQNQFDLLVPGGGVGQNDACSAQWSGVDLGARSGGFLTECQQSGGDYTKIRSCVAQRCQESFGSKPALLAHCNWYVNWFGIADNPTFQYKEIACPSEITNVSGCK